MRVEIGRRSLTPSVLLLVVFAAHAGPTGLDAGTAPASPPVARTVNVEETLFGTKLSDPYRWMEGNDNREFDEWLRAQGAHARRYLDALPGRRPLLERIRDLGLHTSAISDLQIAGGRAFYFLTAPGAQLPVLMVRDSAGERVLADPTRMGSATRHASLNSFAPSPDGSLLAYDVSLGGGEVSEIHVLEVAKGRELPDVISPVWGEFAASWMPDGKAFFYTKMAPSRPDTDPMLDMHVRLHVLGSPVDRDVSVLAGRSSKTLPLAPEEFPSILVLPGSSWMVARVGGARPEARLAVAPLSALDRSGAGKTPWRSVAGYEDHVADAIPHGDRLYLDTFKEASNHRVLSVPLSRPDLAHAKVEIPESTDAVLQGMLPARDGLYLRYMKDGRGRFSRVPWRGKPESVALPYEGWINDFATDSLRDGAMFQLQGWTRPPAYFAVDRQRAVTATGLQVVSTADFSAIVVEEVESVSADGTHVPLTILRPKALSSNVPHPALLYGYGGYAISITPSFQPTWLAWLERGNVYAICHVRGGGERGERWHEEGRHEHKMNGIRDFEACARTLVERKLTSSDRLFGRAGSMGGILIGRTITDQPPLFAGAQIAVGINNPLRMLAAENGANQKGELGDPETETGFRWIEAIDPYQHVQRAPYPAVIFTVGVNDKRVAPWMTGKMAARMMASTTSGRPILVRIDEDAGHGIGSMRDQRFAEAADVYSFFLSVAGDANFAAR